MCNTKPSTSSSLDDTSKQANMHDVDKLHNQDLNNDQSLNDGFIDGHESYEELIRNSEVVLLDTMVDVSCSSNSPSVNEDVDVEVEGNAEGNRNWYDQMKRAFQV